MERSLIGTDALVFGDKRQQTDRLSLSNNGQVNLQSKSRLNQTRIMCIVYEKKTQQKAHRKKDINITESHYLN